MISALIAKRPCFFVMLTAVALFFIRKYEFFPAGDLTEPAVLNFDVACITVPSLYASLATALSGMLYMLVVYKTAERIFGVKEGVYAAIVAGCNIGSFSLFHHLDPMSLMLFFSSGFIGILLVLFVKPRALDKCHLLMFHSFFFLSCCTGIFPAVLLLSMFCILASRCVKEKTATLKVLMNWRTKVVLCGEIGLVILIRCLLSEDGGYDLLRNSFALSYVNNWSQYLKTICAFSVLFVPGVFFILPAIPFLTAVKKNAEFRILFMWSFGVLLAGSWIGGWFGCLLAGFPLSIMLGCVISNAALDCLRYLKSEVGAIAVPTLAVALFFTSLARSDMRDDEPYRHWLLYIAAFSVLYAAFSGGYNMIKRRYYSTFWHFMACYSLLKIVLSLGI